MRNSRINRTRGNEIWEEERGGGRLQFYEWRQSEVKKLRVCEEGWGGWREEEKDITEEGG